MFEVIPAIDLLDGKCVRLKQGSYENITVYSNDPVKIAKQWQDQGALRLHIVDLDGAKTGLPKNLDLIKAIAKAVDIPLEAGGGIRNHGTIKEMIGFGIDRIILGTTAVKNLNLLENLCDEFGEHIAVALDARGDKVATNGWLLQSSKNLIELANEAVKVGAKRFIYTDISRDGMLVGPNLEGIRAFSEAVKAKVIASGGVSSKEDIEKLKVLKIEGCIVGKALYTGDIKLQEVLAG